MVQKKVDTRVQILTYLKNEKRPLRWISKNTKIPYGSVYSIFKQKIMDLTQERLDQINEGLGTDFKLS
tara:strand:+ start:228 stop:431 length:204 start_codon:yes stop_codon:yes gene_type:complete